MSIDYQYPSATGRSHDASFSWSPALLLREYYAASVLETNCFVQRKLTVMRLHPMRWSYIQEGVPCTCFLRQLLFHGSTLTQGSRCGQKDFSENIIRSITRQ